MTGQLTLVWFQNMRPLCSVKLWSRTFQGSPLDRVCLLPPTRLRRAQSADGHTHKSLPTRFYVFKFSKISKTREGEKNDHIHQKVTHILQPLYSSVRLRRCQNQKPWSSSFYSCGCCSVAQSCLTLCDPMDCSMPGFPVLHPEFAQYHVHWAGDAIQPSHPLLPPSPPSRNHSQHQGLF